MNTWCRKLVLLLALAVMPLQGIAASLSVLFCHDEGHLHALHDQGSHDHGVNHDGHQDEGGTTSNHTSHPCCHYTVSAPAVVTLPAALPDFPVRAFAPESLHDLFVPELPHRPPLA
jgi:hypothetical protein